MPATQRDRRLVSVSNLLGGLNTAGDETQMAPNEWRNCQNMMVARPLGGPASTTGSNNLATNDFAAISHPPLTTVTPNATITVTASSIRTAFHKSMTLATGQNSQWPSETWTAGGTGAQTYQNSFSDYMVQCVQQANAAGQTTTSTFTPTAMVLTSAVTGNMGRLVLSTKQTNTANFASGYIRVGSDAGNYYQWNFPTPNADGITVYNLDWTTPSSTTGTPNLSAIDYIQVSSTAGGGGAYTLQFNHIRLAAMSASPTVIDSSHTGTVTAASGNIRDAEVYDITSDGLNPVFLFICGDAIFKTTGFINSFVGGSFTTVIIASGFTDWSAAVQSGNRPHTTRFNFSFMPDYLNTQPTQNVAYFVNGKDGYFRYNANLPAATRFSRISATAWKYISNHKNYMFLFGDPLNPNMLSWSDNNDPTNLTTNLSGNLTMAQSEAGQYGTGLYSFDDYLLIFRSSDIQQLYGNTNNDFALRKTKSKVGALDQKYITRAGSQVFFASFSGIYSLNWFEESQLVSRKVNNLLQSANAPQYVSGFLIYNPLREVLVFSMPGDITNDPVTTFTTSYRLTFAVPQTTYQGNLPDGAWGKLGTNSTADSLAFCAVFYGGTEFVSNNTLTGYMYQFLEAGVAAYLWDMKGPTSITMTYSLQTAWHTGKQPLLPKNFDKAYILAATQSSQTDPASASFQDFYNFSNSSSNTYTVTPIAGLVTQLLAPNSSTGLSVGLSCTATNQVASALELSGWGFVWTQDGEF